LLSVRFEKLTVAHWFPFDYTNPDQGLYVCIPSLGLRIGNLVHQLLKLIMPRISKRRVLIDIFVIDGKKDDESLSDIFFAT
jgi:hypothetical protein